MVSIGYDRDFLGLSVNIPTVAESVVELPYVHFTVMHRADRRLAAITAVNVHGGLLVEIAEPVNLNEARFGAYY